MNTRTLAAALAVIACTGSSTQAAEKVIFALPVVSFTVASVYVADALGVWKNDGLDVELPLISGVGATNAMLAGSADFTVASGPTMIRAIARGNKVIAVATTLDRVQQEVVLSKKAADAAGITASSPIAKKAAALKGKKIAVDSFNSVVHSFLRYVAKKGGVDPDREITVTNAQGLVMLASLKSGAIDGFTLSLPWTLIPVHEGTAISIASAPRGDLPELQPFTYTVVVATPETCKKKAAMCRKMVAGLAKAQTYMKDHPRESMEILKGRIKNIDPAIFAEAYKLVTASTPKTPRIEEPGLVKAQDFMVATGMMKESEKLKSLKGIYTNEFIGK